MTMRSIIRFCCIACFSLIAAVTGLGQTVGAGRADAQSSGYIVNGKVFLPDGKPAHGANVEVNCDFGQNKGVTDEDGVYRITGVAGGSCAISVQMPGFEPLKDNRTISSEGTWVQTFNVPPLYLKFDPYKSNPLYADVPKAALDKYKKAMDKIEKGDADGALSSLDQAIAAHASFAPAWYQKGQIYLKRNESDKAVAAFVKAIEIKADYLEAKYGFGVAQFQKKDYAVSEAVFRDVLQKIDMPEAHLNLGISLFYLKKVDAAEKELKTAAASKTGDKLALAHLYLGQIYIQRKNNADAIIELQKYVELVPKAPNADRVKATIADLKKQS